MNILDKIKSGFTYFDGGYGSLLQSRGLKPGELPENWNIEHPEAIQEIHYEYLLAGSDIIETNTFGANALKYGEGMSTYSLEEIIKSAIENVRQAIAKAKRESLAFVALSIGPLGKLLEPLGDMPFEKAVEIFKEVASLGDKYGVDLILIETMNDIYEAKAAILGAKEGSNKPIFLSCAFDESGKLLTGADPVTVVAVAEGLGVDAVGVNCSVGPDKMIDVVTLMSQYASVPVICNPNAGLPKVVDGKTVYDIDPQDFAYAFKPLVEAGAVILGGCCGSTPEHIKAMHDYTIGLKAKELLPKDYSLVSSYTHSVEIGGPTLLVGERINPTGKSAFKQALRDKDMNYILSQALEQADAKAHVLDVNVGLPEIDEPALMEEVVRELQAVTDLPLQIDTSDTEAMERALRIYNGKAMINSANGKEEVMEAIFPLVAKYGGVCVALTLDESGIPNTARERVDIARKIYEKAADYGIKAKDIIVDPLCMSISADKTSSEVTLEALRMIRDELHGHTILGVSNISFGLPQRDIINASFFTLAMNNGLNAAIMNPNSYEMMKAYRAYNALKALDDNCMDYIEYAQALPVFSAADAGGMGIAGGANTIGTRSGKNDAAFIPGAPERDPLTDAIVRGLKDKAAEITKNYLKTRDSMEIIDDYLIPALDIVGVGFEAKTVFLPQLLMSAEAANSAFAVIKKKILTSPSPEAKASKGLIIMATVKGDIHDIGKNIVKVLLENYGYEVMDLGKDVSPERIVEKARDTSCRLVGLSALMTTTVPAMEATIRQLREAGLDCKVCVGGAVLTQEYADMIGADKYSRDAMDTVRYAEELFNGKL